jgi:hypothetical protein
MMLGGVTVIFPIIFGTFMMDFPRKKQLFGMYLLQITAGILIQAITYWGGEDQAILVTRSVVGAVLFKGTGAMIYQTLSTYISELYPSEMRATAWGVIIMICSIFAIFTPQYLQFYENVLGVNPLTGAACMVLIASFFVSFLPETYGTNVDFDGTSRRFGKEKNLQGSKINLELSIKNHCGAVEKDDGN